MRGYIKSINPNTAKGWPFGHIIGDDGITYYFDSRSLLDGFTMSSYSPQEYVEFEYYYNKKGYPVAKNLTYSSEPTKATKRETQMAPVVESRPCMSSVNDTGTSISDMKDEKTNDEESMVESDDVHDDGSIIKYFDPGYAKSCDPEQIGRHLNPKTREKEIIDKFSEVFSISHVNHHNMGHWNNFPYCIVGATEIIKQFVRDRSEFLLLFAYFHNGDWQQNALRVVKHIRQRNDVADRRPRINFYLLVSNVESLKKEIDHVKGGTEAAVIPFTFNEVLNSSTEQLKRLIIQRFDEYYFENNMLGEEKPIEEDVLLFGDRGKIADAIVQRAIEGSHSGIFGLRRSGKSSVLRAAIRRLEYNKIKYIHIESRSFLESLDSWKTALFDIAREIRKATLGIEQKYEEKNEDFIKRLKLLSTEDDYSKRAAQCFVNDVKQYVKDAPFIIAIDEIELITYNTATSATWRDLDAYKSFWGALRDSGCTLILCGVNSTINESNHISFNGKECDNPMYERIHLCAEFSKNYLPAFTDEQTRNMINQLGSYSNIAFNNVYTEINNAFGGQPYPIRQFCAFVFEKIKDLRKPHEVYEVSKPTFEALQSEFSLSEKGYQLCRTILQHISIYKQEYEKLKDFAFKPVENRTLNPTDSTIIDHLEKYGIIDYDRTTSHVAFKIHILQDYIIRNEDKAPKDMNNDERRSYVQNAVAECEKKLKTYIMRFYQYTSQENLGKTIVLPHIQKKHGAPAQCSFTDLFDHSIYIFHFVELRNIIFSNWSTLGKSFQDHGILQMKFYSIMTDLNAGRSDADHYDALDLKAPDSWEIDELTMETFVVAYNTLKIYFDKMNL